MHAVFSPYVGVAVVSRLHTLNLSVCVCVCVCVCVLLLLLFIALFSAIEHV